MFGSTSIHKIEVMLLDKKSLNQEARLAQLVRAHH